MENDKITMTSDEIIKDYPRLKLEYTRLHEDYRRLQSKQLNIPDVSGCFSFTKYMNEWYEYNDNTENGDVYNNVVTKRLTTEQQIFNEWLKLNNL